MFKVRYLVIAVAAASAVGLAVPVVGFAGPPQTQPPEQGAWCGLVPGTFVDTITSDVQRQADGNSIDHATLRSVFTANETGKSIISSASSTTKSTGPIDLGNGTFGFVTKTTGLVLKFQVPNGSVLKAANGEPLRSAGTLSFEDVFSSPIPSDDTYITTINFVFHGPHLGLQGVDFCGPTVDYLLDP